MGSRIRNFDWAVHPLGPPDAWPQPLRTAVRVILNTGHPMYVFWGPELYCFYNDAYSHSIGPERHPASLGQPARRVWDEIWDIIGPQIDQVMRGDGATWHENALVPITRHGFRENVYWTYSYGPVDDESAESGVGGVLVVCTETTQQVVADERRRTDAERQQRLFEQAPGIIIVMRGPDHLVDFVNDAHQRLFGSADWIGRTIRSAFPSIEGQGFFEEIDRVYETGIAHEAKAARVQYRREADGPLESRTLAFIYAPLHDENGDVSGVFCEGLDVTEGANAAKRHAALSALADCFRDLDDPEQIAFSAAEILGKAMEVSRAGYGTIDTVGETITIDRDWNAPGITSIAGTLHFREYGTYIDDLKAGRTVVVDDAYRDLRTRDTADSLKGISAQSFVNMPVTEQGDTVALLFLNHESARHWPEEDLELIREFAERTRNAVARRRAEAALRQNEARLRFLDSLAHESASAPDADSLLAVTTRMLGEHMDVAICAYADVDDNGDGFTIRGNWHGPNDASIVGRYRLADFGTTAQTLLSAGQRLVIDDTAAELGEQARGFLELGIRATICVPLIRRGKLTAMMAVHASRPRKWTAAERALVGEVTDRSWAHIERARSEAALRESEHRLHLAIDGARIGIWEWDFRSGQAALSKRAAEILGVEHGAQIGESDRFELIHPEDRERVRKDVSAFAAGEDEYSNEYRLLAPDGRIRWASTRGVMIRDDHGNPQRSTGTIRDVTARRQAEESLRALNQTLEQQVADRTAQRDGMWRLSQDLLLVVGPRWDIRAANPAVAALGYSPEEVIGARFDTFAHPDDLRRVRDAIRRAAHMPVGDFTARLKASDGSWRLYSWSAAPGNGEAFVIGRDETAETRRREELELAKEALRQAQKVEALGQLTGGVAHDFNNLLTPIIGSLDLLRRAPNAGQREQRLMSAALESAERARTLVQRLLAFARRQPLQPGPVDLGELIGGMVDLIASTSGPQIRVQVDIPPGLPAALGDANQLEMAVLNLSVNSRDAMPDGGRLTIAAGTEVVGADHRSGLSPGDYIRLTVSDTGTGMDEETLARAIEPFFSTKKTGKGTGLGLSMVHGLASQLGGALLISSRRGLGTTAELLLPITRQDAAPRLPEPSAETRTGAGLVLLVDDEASVRAATHELLSDLGYEVFEADSADSALRQIEMRKPDYLVTDHLMAGMSGTDLGRLVRERHPEIGVLIVSGYAELDAISPDLPRLTKPFRQDELAAMMTLLA